MTTRYAVWRKRSTSRYPLSKKVFNLILNITIDCLGTLLFNHYLNGAASVEVCDFLNNVTNCAFSSRDQWRLCFFAV
jgi:hypothetical protein